MWLCLFIQYKVFLTIFKSVDENVVYAITKMNVTEQFFRQVRFIAVQGEVSSEFADHKCVQTDVPLVRTQ